MMLFLPKPTHDLLLRLGMQFEWVGRTQDTSIYQRYFIHEQRSYLKLKVKAHGQFTYSVDGKTAFTKYMRFGNEQELTELLRDTMLGGVLFRYKLNLLHDHVRSA